MNSFDEMMKPEPRQTGPVPVVIPDNNCPNPLRPPQRRPTGARGECCDPADGAALAYLAAEATGHVREAMRPNGLLGIGKGAGAHSLASGVVPLDTATLKKRTAICYFGASVADADDFLVTSFEFAGEERLQGHPVPLDAFLADVNGREDKLHPMTGYYFDDDVTIKVSVENITGGPTPFHNLYAAIHDELCVKNLQKTPIKAHGSGAMVAFFTFVRHVWSRLFSST